MALRARSSAQSKLVVKAIGISGEAPSCPGCCDVDPEAVELRYVEYACRKTAARYMCSLLGEDASSQYARRLRRWLVSRRGLSQAAAAWLRSTLPGGVISLSSASSKASSDVV